MTIASILKPWGALALGLALVIVGLVIANQPTTFGWFGSPDGTFIELPSPLIVLPVGAAVALAVGVALVAGWAGHRLGARGSRTDEDS